MAAVTAALVWSPPRVKTEECKDHDSTVRLPCAGTPAKDISIAFESFSFLLLVFSFYNQFLGHVSAKALFPRLVYFFNCSKWECRVFWNARSMPSAERLFRAERSGVFFSPPRVEECSTLDETLRSSLSLFSQLTNQSGGGTGLPTVLRLNNNGEVYIARLRVFISLLDQIARLP